jgi:hypothetical protein
MSCIEVYSFVSVNPRRFGANPSLLGTTSRRFELHAGMLGILAARFGSLARLLELFAGRHGNSPALPTLSRRLPELPVHLLAIPPARFGKIPTLPVNMHSLLELLPNLPGSFSGLPDTFRNLAELYPNHPEKLPHRSSNSPNLLVVSSERFLLVCKFYKTESVWYEDKLRLINHSIKNPQRLPWVNIFLVHLPLILSAATSLSC